MNWQPISTAPKDGKPFLAFFPDPDFSPGTGMEVMWWESSENTFLINDEVRVMSATHWMPLPPPPELKDSPAMPRIDPTARGDMLAAKVRAWYEANRETWWNRHRPSADRKGVHADEFMLGFIGAVGEADRDINKLEP
jgi:hypothetical protein